MTFEALAKSRRAGASDEAISALRQWAGARLPTAYVEFLRFSNGAEDWTNLEVELSAAEEVAPQNLGCGVAEFAPALLIIGSDGGGEAVALDRRNEDDPDRWPVVLVPWVDLSYSSCILQAPSFAEWLQSGLRLTFRSEPDLQ